MDSLILSYERKALFQGEKMLMKKLKLIIAKIKAWNKEHTFWSGVLASIVASGIVGILGYFLAVKPVQRLETNFNTLNEVINTNFVSMQTQIGSQNTQFANLQNNLNNLNNQITNMQNEVNDYKSEINNQITNIQKEVNDYKSEINNIVNSQIDNNNGNNSNVTIYNELHISPDLLDALNTTYNSDQAVFASSKKCQFSNQTMTLLTNEKTNKIYTVGDLNNEPLVLHYTDKGEDVFFKGQYDEHGYWDGNCIINRYKNGILVLVMDAEYDSGELIYYRQAFSYEKSFMESKYDVWAIAERQKEEKEEKDYSGFTWTYFKQKEYEQSFETESVVANDIFSIDDFKEHVPLLCEGCYSGYTSNGYYNDDTGNAYLVKFNEYGFVRYLYVGKMANGQADDETGNAWSISRGYDNQNYYYYIGEFREGEYIGEDSRNVTVDEIESYYINPNDYKCELKWIQNI